MGNCCGSSRKSSNFSGAGAGHKLGSSSPPQAIPLEPINDNTNNPIQAPKPAKVSTGPAPDRQKILEATEKRLQESRERGTQQGQGKLSQKLQKEKEKNLKDYAEENLAQREQKEELQWRD